MEHVPDDINEVPEAAVKATWSAAFHHLSLPDSMIETLESVNTDGFWNLHRFASASSMLDLAS